MCLCLRCWSSVHSTHWWKCIVYWAVSKILPATDWSNVLSDVQLSCCWVSGVNMPSLISLSCLLPFVSVLKLERNLRWKQNANSPRLSMLGSYLPHSRHSQSPVTKVLADLMLLYHLHRIVLHQRVKLQATFQTIGFVIWSKTQVTTRSLNFLDLDSPIKWNKHNWKELTTSIMTGQTWGSVRTTLWQTSISRHYRSTFRALELSCDALLCCPVSARVHHIQHYSHQMGLLRPTFSVANLS